MEQVAELRLNTVNLPLIYAKLKWILRTLRQPHPSGTGRSEVIWTFERNGIGEALVALIQNDAGADGGVYIDGVDLYNESMDRLGCYTTNKSKLVTCMQLKNLLEKGNGNGIKINSAELIFELANFVSSGGTYRAKNGATDDSIMALSLIMKLMARVASYDEKAHKVMYENISPDADVEVPLDQFGDQPVPFTFL